MKGNHDALGRTRRGEGRKKKPVKSQKQTRWRGIFENVRSATGFWVLAGETRGRPWKRAAGHMEIGHLGQAAMNLVREKKNVKT